jgi:hypothetical protein
MFGSGALTNTTYRDDEGNEWYSVGGSTPVLTKTAAAVAALAAARETGRLAREAALAEVHEHAYIGTDTPWCADCGADAPAAPEPTTWVVVRTRDNHYAETVNGTRADAMHAAAEYRPNPRTERGLAHIVPCEPDYPATVSARRQYGDRYGDYIQRSLAEKASRGIDRRADTLGALYVGNDGA